MRERVRNTALAAVMAMALGGVVHGQVPFTEEAVARGVNYYVYGGFYEWGRGFTLNDLDGDGDIDLLVTGDIFGDIGVFENLGAGSFIARTGHGIAPSVSTATVIAGDYDSDGDLDLFLGSYDGPDRLYRNDGNWQYTDVTAAAGVGDLGNATGCCWGDYDGDGHLDLYVTTHPNLLDSSNILWRNTGLGTFANVTSSLGLENNGPGFQALFLDYDRDGDVDLYLSNDKGPTLGMQNHLWRNDGGAFTEVSASSGAGISIESMGVGYGDLDRNLWPDFYCTNTVFAGNNVLLLNQGDGTYVDESISYGVQGFSDGWGAPFFDFDNDGWEDLLAATTASPDRLFRGSPVVPLTDVAPIVGVDDSGYTFCAEAADLDGDGDLDLVTMNGNDPIKIFINHEGQLRNHLKVKLESTTGNTFAIGATVIVTAGAQQMMRQVVGSGTYKTGRPYTLHFGLDTETMVDEILVEWPGGLQSVVTGVAANQTIVIDDSAATAPVTEFIRADANADGNFDIADPVATLGVLFLAASAPCDAALDANSDDGIDIADAVFSLSALFTAGASPAAPFPGCGDDPLTSLGCGDFASCP